nr:uncharacterized protein LOC117986090 [Maniola hyperantus]
MVGGEKWAINKINLQLKILVSLICTLVKKCCVKQRHLYTKQVKKRQELLCYTSERRYITEDDAGAPAMRRGRLVAVTVGSANFEGEHVAVGLKMVCFCSWIAENLPQGGSRPQCCKNCCETNSEGDTKKPYRHTHKKREF